MGRTFNELIKYLFVIIFSFCIGLTYINSAHAENWNVVWDRNSETPYTVSKVNESGVMMISKMKDHNDHMVLLAPHGKIEFPDLYILKLVIGVDNTVVHTGNVTVLLGKKGQGKAYVTYINDAVVNHLVDGNKVTFNLLERSMKTNPVQFKFNLDGSQQALAPLVEINL